MKLNRKTLIKGGALAVILLAVSAGIWYSSEQSRKKEVLESIDLLFKNDTHIEYGQKNIDFNDFIKERKGSPEVKLPNEKIDTKELGKKELMYTISKDGYSKEIPLTVEVKDTKAPEIVLKEDSITISYGADFKPEENIKSVKDPVDGDIPYTKEKKENNYYTIEGTVDSGKAGEYKITINSKDKNGNASEKTYIVKVEEQQEQQLQQQSSDQSPIINQPAVSPNGNSNSSSTPPSNSGTNNSSQPNEPTTCGQTNQFIRVGNSGIAGYDSNQVVIDATPGCPDGYKVIVTQTEDTCGNKAFTADYVIRNR